MITSDDHRTITQMLRTIGKTGLLPDLENKLSRLTQINPDEAPEKLIRMNTEIVIRDFQTDEVHELRLVHQLSPLYRNQVSVMSPLGTALLGQQAGSTVAYEGRDLLLRMIFIEKIGHI